MKYLLLFLSFFWVQPAFAQNSATIQRSDRTTIEGVLSQVSKLPAAEGNPYPDCYYTAVITIEHIISGQSIPRKIILVLPGFFSRKYTPEAKFRTGDKVHATIVPFSSMPDAVRQTQQADEIEDVDLGIYFPEKIAAIKDFEILGSPVPMVTHSPKVEGTAKFHSVDLKAKAARQAQIQHDLNEINAALSKHGGDWDKWYDSLRGFRTQYKKQYETKAKRWVGDSFFSAGILDNGKIYSSEFIASVVAFKNYLAARNVDLILVRVPRKGEIVDDLFAPLPPDQISNPYLLRMYKDLLEADVEIISDIVPKAKEARLKYPLMYWYQDFPEPHTAEGMAWIIAEEFAKRVARYDQIKSAPKKILSLMNEQATEGWMGLKWPPGNSKFNTSDFVRFSSVTDNGVPIKLRQGQDSPVLVLGSSYIAAPSFPKGATIPHYFAYLTGVVPDLVHRYNADFMMPRSIAREGDSFLSNRIVCLFPFSSWAAYKPLASLPIFDPDTSIKTWAATYSGPTLRRMIDLSPKAPEGVFSYLPDGMLQIRPLNNESSSVSIKIKVPKEILKFPFFIHSIEFAGKDRSDIVVRYSGQVDTSKRSELQAQNDENFSFSSKSDEYLTVDFTDDKYFPAPITIKSLSFYGVTQPNSYKNTKSTGSNYP